MVAGDSARPGPNPRPVGDEDASRLAPVLAEWAYRAGAPYEDWRFGGADAALTVLRDWVLRPSSEIAAARWRICEVDGRPAGGVAFISGERLAAARRSDLVAMARLPAVSAVRERLAATRDLFGTVVPEDLYLSRIAVDPERRARGLGRRLLQEVVTTAASEGHSRVRLDVAADNTAALGLYERAGFTLVSESVSEEAGLRYRALELRL